MCNIAHLVCENRYKNATFSLTVLPKNIFTDVDPVSHTPLLSKIKLPGLHTQGIYITPHYCRMPGPKSNICFIFPTAELKGLDSATIDSFAAF